MAGTSTRRADIAALRRSDRSKPALLAAVVGTALAAATWSWAGEKGIGEPDDATRVFVVVMPESDVDYRGLLRRAGFHRSFQGTAAQVQERAGQLELDEEGLAQFVAVADSLGYGFLAIERPAQWDWDDLELQEDPPELGEDTRIAVISVGEFAEPSFLTTNNAVSDVVGIPEMGLLDALFRQERLIHDRELLTHNPTVEELNLESQLEPGRNLVRRVARLENTASNVAVDLEKELHEGDGLPLGLALESGAPIPLPDGGVLSLVQDVTVISQNAFTLEYRLADELRFEYSSKRALTEGPDLRRRCEGLMGGAIEVSEFPQLVASADARMLLVSTSTDGSQLWSTLDGDECEFISLGIVPSPASGERGLGVVSNEGRVARTAIDDEGSTRVHVYTAFDAKFDAESGAVSSRLELPVVEGSSLRALTWLDAEHLLAIASHPDAEERTTSEVLLFELHPGTGKAGVVGLELPELTPEGGEPAELVAIPKAPGEFLVTTRDPGGQLFHIRLDLDGMPSASAPIGETSGAAQDGADEVAPPRWPTTRPSVELIYAGPDVSGTVASPDGQWAAFSSWGRLGRVRLGGSTSQFEWLTGTELHDIRPRFTVDGDFVVFESRLQVSVTGQQLGAPRLVQIGDPAEASPSQR